MADSDCSLFTLSELLLRAPLLLCHFLPRSLCAPPDFQPTLLHFPLCLHTLIISYDLCFEGCEYTVSYVMGTEVKQFLYAWCGKQKTAPNYELRAVGSKIRQRFMCEVSMQHETCLFLPCLSVPVC